MESPSPSVSMYLDQVFTPTEEVAHACTDPTTTTSVFVDVDTRVRQDSGVYEAEDKTLRAFVAPSPASPILARQQTQVDLVLPPASAFTVMGKRRVSILRSYTALN